MKLVCDDAQDDTNRDDGATEKACVWVQGLRVAVPQGLAEKDWLRSWISPRARSFRPGSRRSTFGCSQTSGSRTPGR